MFFRIIIKYPCEVHLILDIKAKNYLKFNTRALVSFFYWNLNCKFSGKSKYFFYYCFKIIFEEIIACSSQDYSYFIEIQNSSHDLNYIF